jgi:outer membrane protein TolC
MNNASASDRVAPHRLGLAFAVALLLSGCAQFSQDNGFDAVREAAGRHLSQDIRWHRTAEDLAEARRAVKGLLGRPLTADGAVQIALLNNRGLQATYSDLIIAEAALVQAGRMKNPGFSLSRLSRTGEVEIERKFIFDVLGLLTIPLASEVEARRFEHAKLRVVNQVIQVAGETRKAFYRAVAAQETLKYMQDAKLAAEAAADLGRRMARVGNWSKLNQAREQTFYADVLVQLARADRRRVVERERLTRVLGLWGADTGFQLPDQLPGLPGGPNEIKDIEAAALGQRLDLKMARAELDALASSLGLTGATRFLGVFELSYLRNSETGLPRQTGYEIELSIPIFDWGQAKVARAEHVYTQSAHRFADMAIVARSELREAYHVYRSAYDIARHYRQEILPVRQILSEETLLRYNGMLMSVFELLTEARLQIMDVAMGIEAQRDFWLADVDLQGTMLGIARGSSLDLPGPVAAAPAPTH